MLKKIEIMSSSNKSNKDSIPKGLMNIKTGTDEDKMSITIGCKEHNNHILEFYELYSYDFMNSPNISDPMHISYFKTNQSNSKNQNSEVLTVINLGHVMNWNDPENPQYSEKTDTIVEIDSDNSTKQIKRINSSKNIWRFNDCLNWFPKNKKYLVVCRELKERR